MKTLLPLLSFAFCATGLTAASPLKVARNGKESIRLTENGQPVYTFQLAPKSLDGKLPRANYLHPVYDLNGNVLTEDFPQDHLHHRGIFWAWHQILVNDEPVADSWICKDIEWQVSKALRTDMTSGTGHTAAFVAIYRDWAVGETKQRIVVEVANIKTHVTDPEVGRRIDFSIALKALVDGVTIGGSDNVKGYGGFSPRIRLTDDVRFTGRNGEVKPMKTAVEAGPWLDVTQTLDGKFSGMTMMVHPSHPGYPLKWILRAKRSMQNPQWPGRKPVALSKKEYTILRYRLLLHNKPLTTEQLDAEWQRYAKEAR